MSSTTSIFRREHPEYREKERVLLNERVKKLYNENPEYREKTKQNALNRYYRLKEAKMNSSISVS